MRQEEYERVGRLAEELQRSGVDTNDITLRAVVAMGEYHDDMDESEADYICHRLCDLREGV